MADIAVNAAAVLASANAVNEKAFNAGAAITAGQLVYLDTTTNTWKLMDADAAATGNGISDTRGVALCNAANGQPLVVCKEDIDFTPGITMTNGIAVYASRNAGAVCLVADVGSGNYPTIVGIPKSTTKMNLILKAGGTAV